MRKKAYALLLAFLLLWAAVTLTDWLGLSAAAESPLTTHAQAAVVIDAASGRVLFAHNETERLPMASTTKIMTALLALEQDRQDVSFTVDPDAIQVEGSSMGLQKGDQVTLDALAIGMLLPSGNDAANAAAVRIAGSKQAFAELMNERAAELGMENTHFVTPSGLSDPEHYSSALDLALLAREALQNKRFAEICRQSKMKLQYGNPPYDRWLTNHNRLLRNGIGAVGVKTGFTKAAGRCLVSAVERGGVTLIVVTLNCPNDWNEHTRLYDAFFSQMHAENPVETLSSVSVPVTGGVKDQVVCTFQPTAPVVLLADEAMDVRVAASPMLFAPVKKGQVVGHAQFLVDGVPVGESVLTAGEDIALRQKTKQTFWQWLFGKDGSAIR